MNLALKPYSKLPHPKLSHTSHVVETLGWVLFLVMAVYLLGLIIWSAWEQYRAHLNTQARENAEGDDASPPRSAGAANAQDLYMSSPLSTAAPEPPVGSASQRALETGADAQSKKKPANGAD